MNVAASTNQQRQLAAQGTYRPRPPRRPSLTEIFETALDIVNTDPALRDWIDTISKSRRYRRPTTAAVTPRTLTAAIITLAVTGQHPTVSAAHRLLNATPGTPAPLDAATRQHAGLPTQVTRAQVQYSFDRMRADDHHLDPDLRLWPEHN